MKRCKSMRRPFVDALYHECTDNQQRSLDRHLARCPECRTEFENLATTLNMMDQRERPEPSESFWQGYWDRLRERWEQEPVVRPRRIHPVIGWSWKLGLSAALVLLGITIGRNTGTGSRGGMPPATSDARFVSLEQRTHYYFQKSKVLLLGLVNVDSDTEEETAVNLPRQQAVSQQLIQEAGFLRTAWDSPADQQMLALIQDLEMILRQIANLESETDFEGIELLKTGVDRKSIFLKITMQEMRRNEAITDNSSESQT